MLVRVHLAFVMPHSNVGRYAWHLRRYSRADARLLAEGEMRGPVKVLDCFGQQLLSSVRANRTFCCWAAVAARAHQSFKDGMKERGQAVFVSTTVCVVQLGSARCEGSSDHNAEHVYDAACSLLIVLMLFVRTHCVVP